MGDSDATECTPCPPGSTTLAPGSTECVLSTCPAGQFVDGNGCSGCPAGTFQPFFATTATECPQCPVGEASESGASECAPCSPLQTTSGPGSTECIDITCPFGEELVISGGSASCVPIICNAGQFVDGNGCSDCPAGTFQPDIGSTATKCQQCLVGEISGERAGTCLACPPGETTSGPGSTECVPVICAAGFLVDGDDCLKCIPGTFQPDNESTATECSICTPGSFSDAPGLTDCTLCPIGTYEKFSISAACTSCPSGTTTAAPGSTSETDCIAITCAAGQFADGNGCSPCSPGSFQPTAPFDGNECTPCPDGTTSEDNGATECTPIVIKGCTDEDAINFESDATEDDGTCIFLHVAKAGGGSKVYGIGPHSQVTSGNGAFALRNRNSGTDLSISNSATWASSGLFGKAAGDSGAEAMTGVPQTSVAKSYSDAIMTNFDYNPVGKANSYFSGQGTSKRSPIEVASGADVSIVTPHFAGSSSSIFAGVSKSDPSLRGTYADVLSRGGGALKYTAIDVGRPSFDHLHG